jgi:hypothetical protein
MTTETKSMSSTPSTKRQRYQQKSMSKRSKSKSSTNKSIITSAVRFNQSVMVKETLHINNYTDKEIESCWYTSHEYNTIQKGLFMTLDFMKLLSPSSSSPTSTTNLFYSNSSNNNKNNDVSSSLMSSMSMSSYCMRGLEDLSSSGTKKSSLILRQNAIVAVLDEQDRQVENAYHLHIQQLQLQQHHDQQQQQDQDQDQDHHEQEHEQVQDVFQLLNQNLDNMNLIICYDDIKIRNIFRKYTRISEDIAYSRGLSDAAEAEALCVQHQHQQRQHNNNDDDDDDVRYSCENPLFSSEKRWNFNTTSAPTTVPTAIGRGVLLLQSCTTANTARQQQQQQQQLLPQNSIILQ